MRKNILDILVIAVNLITAMDSLSCDEERDLIERLRSIEKYYVVLAQLRNTAVKGEHE